MRQICTERLPTGATPWARRPIRRMQRVGAVGLALGGKAGRRLSPRGGVTVSRHTLLRVLRRQPLPVSPTPAVLGVGDWSLRNRHTSGTILVDRERRWPIARLRDRDAATLASWLRAHPGVQSITPDRSKAAASGARQGAPAAMQVADRVHLGQKLAEVLEQVFRAQLQALNEARHHPPGPQPSGALAAPVPPPLHATDAVVQAQQRRVRRLATDEPGWALPRQGYTGDASARPLRIGQRTLFRSLRTATVPARRGRSARGRRVLEPDTPSRLSRWNAGCRAAFALCDALKGQGYPGRYPTVARYVQRLRQAQGLSTRQRCTRKPVPAGSAPATPRRTPRRATWLGRRRPDTREAREAQGLTARQGHQPAVAEATPLAQDVARLVRRRPPDQLEPWLARAASRLSEACQRFAKRLREDSDAVKAGVTLPWRNGPVAGHIKRLKMRKRQMFGRAKLDLRSRRLLSASERVHDQAPGQQTPLEAPAWAAAASPRAP